MRIAIIDCGTNTFHLLIAACGEKGSIRNLHRSRATVKLSAVAGSNIAAVPYKRGLKALAAFKRYINKYKVGVVKACATSALREASNGREFIREAGDKYGIRLEIISGIREAELIYKGVLTAITPAAGTSLIMDIGGGSVEFIIFSGKGIAWKKSFRLGAAYLNQLHPLSDPATEREVSRLHRFLSHELTPLLHACKRYRPLRLIGSAGSFETFAQMIRLRKGKAALKNETEDDIAFADYQHLHARLLQSTTAGRMNMKGLVKMRVDMIVMASLLLTFVLEKTGIQTIKLSTFSLKEGILAETVNDYCKPVKQKR